MAKKKLLESKEATENLGYLIKLIVGSVIIIGVIIYLIFFVKPDYDQVKELLTFIIIYLMGYGTQRLVKKNEQ